jgi:hypothetical protein
VVGKSAKVHSSFSCHSGQFERGTKTRIATFRMHVAADKQVRTKTSNKRSALDQSEKL